MVETFSAAYFLTNCYIMPHNGDRAIMQLDWFEQLQRLYADTKPLIFKRSNRYIPVYGEQSVPGQTIAVPREIFEELGVDETELSALLLAKPETVDRLIAMQLIGADA